jgi:acetyltransferase-like isoleucine patch superfamily enzyme
VLARLYQNTFAMNLLAKAKLRMGWRAVAWRSTLRGKVRLGERAYVGPGAELIANARGEQIVIGSDCRIHRDALLHCYGGQITIGNNVGINPFCVLYGHGGLTIGNDVLIATGCVMIPANHDIDDPGRSIRSQGLSCQGITIEDDVWIGARAVILDGVTIHRGAVIGAGAVVANDVPPGAIAVGVPAKVKRYRGDDCSLPPTMPTAHHFPLRYSPTSQP